MFGAAKVAFFNRDTLATLLGLPVSSIDLIENDVGGGFGARGEFYPEDFLIPFAARRLDHPVRWIEDRREHLIAMNHARETDCDIEIACRRDGTILGVRGEVFVDIGAYIRTTGPIAPRTATQFLTGPYRVRTSASPPRRCSPTRRRPAPIARRGATKAVSSSSGFSNSQRTISASTLSRCGGAT